MKNTKYKEDYEELGTNAELCINTDAPVRWRLGNRKKRRHAKIIIGLLLAFVVLFIFSKPTTTSPFVGALLDLLDPDASWLLPQFEGRLGMSFWLSMIFILLLTYLLAQMRFGLLNSDVESKHEINPVTGEGSTTFYRRIYLQPLRLSRGSLVFWVMGISNLLLFIFYRERIVHKTELAGNMFFSVIYAVAIVSRLLALFWGVGTLLQFFLYDYGRRIKEFLSAYGRYFYPPVLSILIVVYVFSRMDQFDGLFIELVRSPGNLLLFTLLFLPASIVIVWFAPNYLWFTDYNFSDRRKIWSNIQVVKDAAGSSTRGFWRRLYGTIYKHKRLNPGPAQMVKEEEVPEYFSRFRRKDATPTSEAFHRTRTMLGLLYLVTLASLSLSIFFDNSNYFSGWKSIILLLVVVAALGYWSATMNTLRKSVQEKNERWRVLSKEKPQGNRWQRLYDYHYKNEPERVYLVKNRWFFRVGQAVAVSSALLLILTLITGILSNSWYYPFLFFTLALCLTPMSFVWLSIFRRFYKQYTFDPDLPTGYQEAKQLLIAGVMTKGDKDSPVKVGASPLDRRMDRLDSWIVQLMLDFILVVGLAFIVFFLAGLALGDYLMASDLLEMFNPLNLFLLVLNGLIACILLTDRFLLVHEHGRQFAFFDQLRTNNSESDFTTVGDEDVVDYKTAPYDRTGAINLFWGTMLVLVLLMSWYFGNTYHEVGFQERTAQNEPLSLEDYTQRFWQRYQDADPSKPILMIASDGGGLKACYWTLRNLLELDRMGLVDNNLFMSSGASGGNMGLSMYTFLKANPALSLDDIEERIEALGSRNFLSGDLTGFITRFPLRYLPNHFNPDGLYDRTEAMARAYFRIACGGDPKFDYAYVRQRPYSAIWEDLDYNLPVFVANTSRAEDGMRGVAHPFQPDPDLTAGMVDLTHGQEGWISYPDAAFLSNRFPLVSPAARIKGKGHFLDAGQSDNSGLATIYQFLNYLKAQTQRDDLPENSFFQDSTFREEFFSRVVVISLRNAPSRFTRDVFLDEIDQLGRLYPRSEVAANTSTAINTGLTGVPRAWDDYLRSSAPQQLGIIDTFLAINLPFRISTDQVQSVMGGEVQDPQLAVRVDSINCRFFEAAGCVETGVCDQCAEEGTDYPRMEGPCFTVEPPLGRLLTQPALELMDQMVDYVDVRELRNWLDTTPFPRE